VYFHRAVIEGQGVIIEAATSVVGSRVSDSVKESGVAPKSLKRRLADEEVVVHIFHGNGFLLIAILGVGEATL